MAWVRVEDHFDEHPKFQKVGPLGIALWVAGLAYCNRNLTDGFIPIGKVAGLVNWKVYGPLNDRGQYVEFDALIGIGDKCRPVDAQWVAGLLVHAGLWDEVEHGYKVHDYLDYQPSKVTVLSERKRTAERVAKHRAFHSNAPSNAVSNGVSNTVSNGHVTPAPYPYPNPSEKKKRRSPSARAEDDPGFVKFYSDYPRKTGRIEAEKAWRSKRIKSQEDLDRVMTGLDRWKQHWAGKDPEFIPYPATWLRGARWNDDPSPGSGNGAIVAPGASNAATEARLQWAERLRKASGRDTA